MLYPNAKVWRYLVYLKYWTLSLRPLMIYPKVLTPPNFSIKVHFVTQPIFEDLARGSAVTLAHVPLCFGSSLMWLTWPRCLPFASICDSQQCAVIDLSALFAAEWLARSFELMNKEP